MLDRSCILLVTNANKAALNKALARIFVNPPNSDNLIVSLSHTGNLPATHWCNHIWRTGDDAAVLEALPTAGGTLPTFTDGLDWVTDFGITEAEVIAAIAAPNLTVYVATGGVPTEHLAGVLAANSLLRIGVGGEA